MLILTRKSGEGIRIGKDIVLTVLENSSGYVRIGVEAPRDIPVYRNEIYESIQEENRAAAMIANIKPSLFEGLKRAGSNFKNS